MNVSLGVQLIASTAWVAVVVLLFIVIARAARKQPIKGLTSALIGLVIVALLMSTLGAGLVFIEPDELAVVITLQQGGIRPEPLGAGIHFVIPFVERVERFSILRQTYTMTGAVNEGQVSGDDSIQVRTKDGQMAYLDATVIYAINPAKAVDLYKTWRNGYEEGLVRPQTRGIIRSVASQFGIEEIVSSQRLNMEEQITAEMTQVFDENNLILVDFVLRNITFSDEYATAVEQKQIAEQQAQQAKFVVESKKQEAEQARQTAQGLADALVIEAQGNADARLIEAEAEAKALQMIANVIANNPDLLQYEYIQKLAAEIDIMLLPSDAPFILPQFGGLNSTTPSLTP